MNYNLTPKAEFQANAKNLEKVQALLAKLDTEVAGGLRTELMILKNAKAADVAPTLSRMAQTASSGPGGAISDRVGRTRMIVAGWLVYAAGPQKVTDMMVDGKWLMRERRLLTLDEEKVLEEAQKAAEKLVEKG